VQIGQLMATGQPSDEEKPIEDNVGTQPIQPSFPNLFNKRKRKEYERNIAACPWLFQK